MMISSLLSTCHEKATEALERFQTRSGVALIFCLRFASDFFSLLLVRLHQAGIIIVDVKHHILEHSNEARVGVDPSTLRSWPS